ncbi:MAG: VWA domain-containing protein [Kiritimatiellia bacterium]
MNENLKSYTHVALVLDASGSMERLRETTISTMKEFFESLRSPEDKTVIDLWQFDDRVRHLIDGVDLAHGSGKAIENYTTGGCTALYDAICIGIDELGRNFAAMAEDDRPDAVVFAILTDGFENASQRFSARDAKRRIAHQTEKYNWTFRFLAANQDAALTGREMGLDDSACMSIQASDEGLKAAHGFVAGCCCDMRPLARETRARKRKAKKADVPGVVEGAL